jgi:cell division transport system permease protein
MAGLKRNRSSTIITVFTVGIALLLLGFFALLTLNFSQMVESMRSRVEVEAFLRDAPVEQHRLVGIQLKHIEGVEDAQYVSKEEAASQFEKEIGEDFNGILESNPLPASYRLTIKPQFNNPDNMESLVQQARKTSGVDTVVYRKQFLNILDRRARAFGLAALFIGLALAVSAVILVANTIRLAIFARRETIRTMKLVGATVWFIRIPFLVEGAVQGMIGGILATIFIFVTFTFFLLPISEDLMITISIQPLFYIGLAAVGSVLGLIGSMVSLGRFLREALHD